MYTPEPAPTYKGKFCLLRSESLCRQAKVCIPQSLPAPTYKGKCVCFVMKACADKRKYVYPRACADIQRKVCMLRSKSLCRQAKVCIPQSLPAPTYKGKCVCLVLEACANKRKYVYPRACADIQRKVCMPRSKSLCQRTNRGSVYNRL